MQIYNCGYQTVGVGDSIAKLSKACGQPDRTVALQSTYGAGVGERWEYFRKDGKVVAFVISNSRVQRIDRVD